MRPNWPFVAAYSQRGAWCWLATRSVLSAARWLGQLPPIRVPTATATEIVVMTVGVSVLESARRRERALIGNLAVHPALIAACFAIPAFVAEGLLRAMWRA